MPTRKLLTDAALRHETDQPGAAHVLANSILAAIVGAVALLAFAQLPMGLALPAVSILLVITGFTLAAVSYLRGAPVERGYEIAAILVFLGFAAALMADGDQTLALIEQLERQGLAALAE